MAMIGEQFMVGNEICGMVLSLRYPWDQVKNFKGRALASKNPRNHKMS